MHFEQIVSISMHMLVFAAILVCMCLPVLLHSILCMCVHREECRKCIVKGQDSIGIYLWMLIYISSKV